MGTCTDKSALLNSSSPPYEILHPIQGSILRLLILCLENNGQLSIPKHQFPPNVSNYDSNLSRKENVWPYTNIINTDIFWGGKYGARHPIPGTDLVVRHLPGPHLWSTPNEPVSLKLGVLLLFSFNVKVRSLILNWGLCHLCLTSSTPFAFCHYHKRTPASPSTPATLHPYPSRQLFWLTM